MWAYESIRKGITWLNTKHDIPICKRCISEKLKEDISKIKQSPNVFVFTDKTSNIYEMPKKQHKKLLHDNVTKTYKKAAPKLETSINLEAKNIAKLINLDDRIEL